MAAALTTITVGDKIASYTPHPAWGWTIPRRQLHWLVDDHDDLKAAWRAVPAPLRDADGLIPPVALGMLRALKGTESAKRAYAAWQALTTLTLPAPSKFEVYRVGPWVALEHLAELAGVRPVAAPSGALTYGGFTWVDARAVIWTDSQLTVWALALAEGKTPEVAQRRALKSPLVVMSPELTSGTRAAAGAALRAAEAEISRLTGLLTATGVDPQNSRPDQVVKATDTDRRQLADDKRRALLALKTMLIDQVAALYAGQTILREASEEYALIDERWTDQHHKFVSLFDNKRFVALAKTIGRELDDPGVSLGYVLKMVEQNIGTERGFLRTLINKVKADPEFGH